MYILQESLFSFEEWLQLESKERLEIFFSSLDLRPYAKQLKSRTPQGAPGYCREAILRAFLAAPMEGITTFTMLHRRLQRTYAFATNVAFVWMKMLHLSLHSTVYSRIWWKNRLLSSYFMISYLPVRPKV